MVKFPPIQGVASATLLTAGVRMHQQITEAQKAACERVVALLSEKLRSTDFSVFDATI